MAVMSDIDSFCLKFQILLIAGQNTRLKLRAETGKATVNLTVEVDVSLQVPQARNSPSRQRHRERIAAGRVVAE